MNKHTHRSGNDLGTLAEDARALIAATVDVAGEKVGNARERLTAALDSAKDMAGSIHDKAIQGAKATDKAVHANPYKAMGIAFGVGALVGIIAARWGSRSRG